VGYFYLFEYRRYRLQKEVLASMYGGKVKLIVLEIQTPSQNKHFKWVHRREFLFHGKMFDVLYEKITKSSTVFYCVQDHREDHLNAGMKNAIQKKIADLFQDLLIKCAMVQSRTMINLSLPVKHTYGDLSLFFPYFENKKNNPPPEIFFRMSAIS
jgi:hypothetical protein